MGVHFAALKKQPCGSWANTSKRVSVSVSRSQPRPPALEPLFPSPALWQGRRVGWKLWRWCQPALTLLPHTLGAMGRGPATGPSSSRQKQVQKKKTKTQKNQQQKTNKKTYFYSGSGLGLSPWTSSLGHESLLQKVPVLKNHFRRWVGVCKCNPRMGLEQGKGTPGVRPPCGPVHEAGGGRRRQAGGPGSRSSTGGQQWVGGGGWL